MTSESFEHVELRRTFWARHLLHRMETTLRRRHMNVTAYTLCAFPRDFIGREIAICGTFEASGIAAVRWLCKTGVIKSPSASTFLDVGANIGVYTVALADAFARVLAFEPHPVVNRVLGLNIAINNLDNAVSLDYGLSDVDANAELWEGVAENLGTSSVERGIGIGASHTVKLRHAATAVREAADHPVAFVKMDVEGHEPHVVAGLRSVLAEQHPVVAFEANDAVHNDDMLRQLQDLGYGKFLALDYGPSVRSLWMRVAALTLFGVRTVLKPVSDLRDANYSLVFALHSEAAAAYESIR